MLFLVVTVPIVLGAGGEHWRAVAKSDVKFAQELSKENVRFGPEFMRLIEETVKACQPLAGQLDGRDSAEVRQIMMFCRYFCIPWHETWAEALAPCEEEPARKWCSGGRRLAAHLQIEPYFETLTAELQASDKPLERYNIMAVLSERAAANVLRDFPHDKIDEWLAHAVSSYLQAPPPTDAIAIGQVLNAKLSFGRSSALAREFAAYADRADSLSSAERRELHELAAGLREKPN